MSNQPRIVQGTPVASPYEHNRQSATQSNAQNASGGEFTGKGEKQETKCNDPIFAALLYANVIAIAVVAGIYGTDPFKEHVEDGKTESDDYTGYMYAALITGGCALLFSAVMLAVLMRFASILIKVSLIIMVVFTGIWAVLAIMAGNIMGGIIGLIFFCISVCYARVVWGRIPFATANLVTACTAVKNNCGITFVAYFVGFLAFGWSILWTLATLGVFDQSTDCVTDEVTGKETCEDISYGWLFLLLVSYFFTHQVLQNVVHVTVAGTVGTWWFSPEEGSACCSAGVLGSLVRSLTTSFGSICFGSLIVAVLQALRQLAHMARQEDNSFLLCIAECILSCIESLVEYFNKWAYIYVGLYGYGYIDAGKNVFTLFKNRGWEAIIADDLVGNALLLVSFVVGGFTGLLGILLAETSDLFDETTGDTKTFAFVFGLIIGLMLCSILMSVIGSGVNTVIVLFAEAPSEFEENYPELSQEMRTTWRQAYPGSI